MDFSLSRTKVVEITKEKDTQEDGVFECYMQVYVLTIIIYNFLVLPDIHIITGGQHEIFP